MKASVRILVAALSTAGWLCSVTDLSAAAYLKLGDIKGESTDDAHKDWIIIQSVSHELFTTIDATTGRPTGKRQHRPFTVIKPIDKSTPLLMEACVNGQSLPIVRLELVRSGERTRYYEVILENVLVTSYETSGQAGDPPTESFSLNYEKIKWTYTTWDKSGTPDEDHSYYWDLIRQAGESDVLPAGSFRLGSNSTTGANLTLEWEGFEEFEYRIQASPSARGEYVTIQTFDPPKDGRQQLPLPIGVGNQFIKIEKVPREPSVP